MDDTFQCTACGGLDFLRTCRVLGRDKRTGQGLIICSPCLAVWYEPDEPIDSSDPAQVGALSLKLRAQGKDPWTGAYAPGRSARLHEKQSNPYDPT